MLVDGAPAPQPQTTAAAQGGARTPPVAEGSPPEFGSFLRGVRIMGYVARFLQTVCRRNQEQVKASGFKLTTPLLVAAIHHPHTVNIFNILF